jgi:hypothetical protein
MRTLSDGTCCHLSALALALVLFWQSAASADTTVTAADVVRSEVDQFRKTFSLTESDPAYVAICDRASNAVLAGDDQSILVAARLRFARSLPINSPAPLHSGLSEGLRANFNDFMQRLEERIGSIPLTETARNDIWTAVIQLEQQQVSKEEPIEMLRIAYRLDASPDIDRMLKLAADQWFEKNQRRLGSIVMLQPDVSAEPQLCKRMWTDFLMQMSADLVLRPVHQLTDIMLSKIIDQVRIEVHGPAVAVQPRSERDLQPSALIPARLPQSHLDFARHSQERVLLWGAAIAPFFIFDAAAGTAIQRDVVTSVSDTVAPMTTTQIVSRMVTTPRWTALFVTSVESTPQDQRLTEALLHGHGFLLDRLSGSVQLFDCRNPAIPIKFVQSTPETLRCLHLHNSYNYGDMVELLRWMNGLALAMQQHSTLPQYRASNGLGLRHTSVSLASDAGLEKLSFRAESGQPCTTLLHSKNVPRVVLSIPPITMVTKLDVADQDNSASGYRSLFPLVQLELCPNGVQVVGTDSGAKGDRPESLAEAPGRGFAHGVTVERRVLVREHLREIESVFSSDPRRMLESHPSLILANLRQEILNNCFEIDYERLGRLRARAESLLANADCLDSSEKSRLVDVQFGIAHKFRDINQMKYSYKTQESLVSGEAGERYLAFLRDRIENVSTRRYSCYAEIDSARRYLAPTRPVVKDASRSFDGLSIHRRSNPIVRDSSVRLRSKLETFMADRQCRTELMGFADPILDDISPFISLSVPIDDSVVARIADLLESYGDALCDKGNPYHAITAFVNVRWRIFHVLQAARHPMDSPKERLREVQMNAFSELLKSLEQQAFDGLNAPVEMTDAFRNICRRNMHLLLEASRDASNPLLYHALPEAEFETVMSTIAIHSTELVKTFRASFRAHRRLCIDRMKYCRSDGEGRDWLLADVTERSTSEICDVVDRVVGRFVALYAIDVRAVPLDSASLHPFGKLLEVNSYFSSLAGPQFGIRADVIETSTTVGRPADVPDGRDDA